MKYNTIFILHLTGLLFFNSCNDWLNVTSTTEVDREDLLKTEEGYSEAITGVYSGMSDVSLYGKNMTFTVLDVMAGRYNVPSGDLMFFRDDYLYKRNDPESSKKSYTVNIINQFWSGIYTQIANLNSIINTIDDNRKVFSGNNYEVVKGEAIGLRAFLHFEIVRMFSPAYQEGSGEVGIPFVSELNTGVSPLLSVDNILKKIIEELKEAIELLENDPMHLGKNPSKILASPVIGQDYVNDNIESWHNRRFHFNYYAAKATLARVYLWMGDKTNALKYAQEVIDAQEEKFPWVIPANVTSISTSSERNNLDGTFATEQIFALNVTKLALNIQGTIDFRVYGFLYCILDVSNEYDFADYRRYLFETHNGNQMLIKYIQHNSLSSYFKERIPMIKLSEMYYIAAECKGPGAEGVGYLNKVRDNRGLTAYQINQNVNENTFLEELLKEYQKEFFGEGQLWYFYKRHNYNTIPNTNFNDISRYTFDLPEEEEFFR